MNRLWLRLGCAIEITDEELERLKDDPAEVVASLFYAQRVMPDGESYFPDGVEENRKLLKDNNGDFLELEFYM